MNDNNACYVINELLTALQSITYRDGDKWRVGVRGDWDVTDDVGSAAALAEEWLRQTEQKGENDE